MTPFWCSTEEVQLIVSLRQLPAPLRERILGVVDELLATEPEHDIPLAENVVRLRQSHQT